MTLQLHQPMVAPGTPSSSPFCTKTEILLQMAASDFVITPEFVPSNGPKKKIPFLTDGDTVIGDSALIQMHLENNHQANFYQGLSPLERATAELIMLAVEEKLYWVMVYARWQIDAGWAITEPAFFGMAPASVRAMVSAEAREDVLRNLWGQGTGRHTEAEAIQMGVDVIDNLSLYLGDRDFFIADTPTPLDAVAYGTLISLLEMPGSALLKDAILAQPHLCAFVDRMSAKFFPNALGAVALRSAA